MIYHHVSYMYDIYIYKYTCIYTYIYIYVVYVDTIYLLISKNMLWTSRGNDYGRKALVCVARIDVTQKFWIKRSPDAQEDLHVT